MNSPFIINKCPFHVPSLQFLDALFKFRSSCVQLLELSLKFGDAVVHLGRRVELRLLNRSKNQCGQVRLAETKTTHTKRLSSSRKRPGVFYPSSPFCSLVLKVSSIQPGLRIHLEALLHERKWSQISWYDDPLPFAEGECEGSKYVCVPTSPSANIPLEEFVDVSHPATHFLSSLFAIRTKFPLNSIVLCVIDVDSNFVFLNVDEVK